MPEPVDPHHLLLIGARPGVGAGVVRRFGREGFRSTLISRSASLDQLAPELRSGGLEIEDLLEHAARFPGGLTERHLELLAKGVLAGRIP